MKEENLSVIKFLFLQQPLSCNVKKVDSEEKIDNRSSQVSVYRYSKKLSQPTMPLLVT